ncbi:MAG: hypothetical protein GY765_13105, partial [bacterium]|nr:hypothetical protein [bacterium]
VSNDFSTAVLVFLGGIGWAAPVVFQEKKDRFLLYFHFLVALAFPLLMIKMYDLFSLVQHRVAIGLIAVGIVSFKLFTAYHLKNERKKEERERSCEEEKAGEESLENREQETGG